MKYPIFVLALALSVLLVITDGAFARAKELVPPPAPLPIDPGAPMATTPHGGISMQGNNYDLSKEWGNSNGLLVPDMDGNYVLVPGGKRPKPDPGTVDAQELKLKVRELAAQLLDTWPNGHMAGLVGLPTSFVNLNDFDETNPLGRYMAEALFYEFNTRGFATREYRANGSIHFQGDGEHALSRTGSIKVDGDWGTIIVGTYLKDQDALFINARMLRPKDGLVLRTAQLVMPMTPLLGRLSTVPPPHPLRSGGLRIVQGRR